MEAHIEQGAALIGGANRILAFTGAGLSTESGIPDFRSPGGLWEKYDPSEFAFDRFLADERAREAYWRMSSEAYALMKKAEPNRAHLALNALEDMGRLLAIVTQNIDRLHHRAGNAPEKIIEIHGTTFSVSCLRCGKGYAREEIESRLRSGVRAPTCDACSGLLKPDTISFGQAMPEDKMARSMAHAAECDLCLVLGSSLVVYPAAAIPLHAADRGARLMIVNRERTPLDPRADLVVHDSVGRVLGEILERVRS